MSRSLYQIQKSVLFSQFSSFSCGATASVNAGTDETPPPWAPKVIVGSVLRRFILPFNFFSMVACSVVIVGRSRYSIDEFDGQVRYFLF